MSNIAAKTYRLPIVEKLTKGQAIITMSTDNPHVTGNEAAVARLAAAQAALEQANLAYEMHCSEAKALLTQRNAAVQEWNAAITGLASLTESLTDGDPEKILSTGYGVRAPKSAPQSPGAIEEVRVQYDGKPGYSLITWKSDPHASAYRVQFSPDPITDTSWVELGVSIEAKYRGNGATPGERCWYRIAAVNRLGQGPWSMPALRPVM